MTYSLATTAQFERRARKFLRKHPDLKPALSSVLERLPEDPFEPGLRLHRLTGRLSGIQAVSLTHGYRLTLIVRITEREILLLDIGSHKEVFPLEKDLLRQLKVVAARRSTSISGLVSAELRAIVEQNEQYDSARRRALAALDQGLHLGGAPTPRDELHER